MARGGTSFSELKNREVKPTTEQGRGFWRQEPDWHQPLFAVTFLPLQKLWNSWAASQVKPPCGCTASDQAVRTAAQTRIRVHEAQPHAPVLPSVCEGLASRMPAVQFSLVWFSRLSKQKLCQKKVRLTTCKSRRPLVTPGRCAHGIARVWGQEGNSPP